MVKSRHDVERRDFTINGERIEEQSVDGEIAALDVVARGGGVAHRVRMASVEIGSVGAEGGDLDMAWGMTEFFGCG